ncbi:MAG: hypothetical protein KBC95_01715 [Candidatus Peribacteraceae bacterium]|nr:hypothetical protein [Candidatus Peribacteraceae bacterium]
MKSPFLCGIEHEIAFLRDDGRFADFTNTTFEELDAVIEKLPVYEADYPVLRVGDLGIKKKRWYIEGFERYGDQGEYLRTVPKGIEIRTTPRASIAEAVAELEESYALLRQALAGSGFTPVWLSFNPIQEKFTPTPSLNAWEANWRQSESPETLTGGLTVMTFGPDVSLSFADWDDARAIDAGKKLTFYSPVLVPFSFSSPFYRGELWQGGSIRTFIRTGARPAAMVFLHDNANAIKSAPSLTQPARVPAEAGRIEFKAFDAQRDFMRYAALLALLKGVVLDQTLPGRALVPDAAAHQHAAERGFRDQSIARDAGSVLAAARAALANDPDAVYLAPLEELLAKRATPADEMSEAFRQSASLTEALRKLTY